MQQQSQHLSEDLWPASTGPGGQPSAVGVVAVVSVLAKLLLNK